MISKQLATFFVLAAAGLLALSGPAVADSIYPTGENGEQTTSLFREVYEPGDIVLIEVEERVSADQGVNLDVSRSSEVSSEVERDPGFLENMLGPIFDILGTGEASMENENENESDGTTSRTTQLNYDLSAVIVEVMDNGNLLLEARKEIDLNRETQIAVVQAMARPEDIDGNNSISSERLADVQLKMIGEGQLSEKTKPGFLSRIFNKIF